jgi:hypothetical protein
MANDRSERAAFNGRNEKEGMQEEFREERQGAEGEFSKTENELSLGNSVRNFGEVSGTTFGDKSNTAKFSNTGQKNQVRSGDADAGNIENVNKANRQRGNGGTMYSDYLNQSQNEFISGTGQFDRNAGDTGNVSGDSIRPSDAMQGNRESGSGGQS